MATGPHVSIAAESVGTMLGVPITNSFVTSYVVIAILVVISLVLTSRQSLRPSNIQLIGEMLIEGLYNFYRSIIGDKHIKTVFPILASIFIYVMIANWIGFFPGVGTIGFYESKSESNQEIVGNHASVSEENTKSPEAEVSSTKAREEHKKLVPFFRGPTADLNVTLSLAICTMIFVQYFGLKTLGLSYLSKFFNFQSPIFFFVGILELVSDLSKIVSFSFRLFGNIFAGEVLLAVMSFLVPFFVPAPFYGLEVFVGMVQALVFSMLACVFMNVAVAHGEHASEDKHAHH